MSFLCTLKLYVGCPLPLAIESLSHRAGSGGSQPFKGAAIINSPCGWGAGSREALSRARRPPGSRGGAGGGCRARRSRCSEPLQGCWGRPGGTLPPAMGLCSCKGCREERTGNPSIHPSIHPAGMWRSRSPCVPQSAAREPRCLPRDGGRERASQCPVPPEAPPLLLGKLNQALKTRLDRIYALNTILFFSTNN